MELVKNIYTLTKDFPQEELYGLTSQMRRAAISIPSNIAEGFRRFHKKEYIQFLYTALGSSAELETQILISLDLKYFSNNISDDLCEKIDHFSRMTNSLIQKLKNS
jgi:four helix bundle protein